jgi:hypothetical protein
VSTSATSAGAKTPTSTKKLRITKKSPERGALESGEKVPPELAAAKIQKTQLTRKVSPKNLMSDRMIA